MTNEEKARYEELDAKDCLIDCEDIIDYYSLRCEILEERLELLEKENKELKEQRLSLSLQLQDYKLIKEITLPNVLEENEKLKKAISILKDKFELELDKKFLSGEYPLVYRHTDYGRYAKNLSQQEYDLLKEVLE